VVIGLIIPTEVAIITTEVVEEELKTTIITIRVVGVLKAANSLMSTPLPLVFKLRVHILTEVVVTIITVVVMVLVREMVISKSIRLCNNIIIINNIITKLMKILTLATTMEVEATRVMGATERLPLQTIAAFMVNSSLLIIIINTDILPINHKIRAATTKIPETTTTTKERNEKNLKKHKISVRSIKIFMK